MKISRLISAECYRFWHSAYLVKYLVLGSLAVFSLGYLSVYSNRNFLEKEMWAEQIWMALVPDYLYLAGLICMITAAYVGREYHIKTINYELLQGYGIEVIALSKMITSCLFSALIVFGGMLLVIGSVPGALSSAGFCRLMLLLLFFFHIFSVSALYVMVFKNTVVGGIVAFFRFTILEGLLYRVLIDAAEGLSNLLASLQWQKLLDVKTVVSGSTGLWMICVIAIEEVLLFCVLRFLRHRVNY